MVKASLECGNPTYTLHRTSDDAGNPAVAVQYAFETFFGTVNYFCMMCGSTWSRHRIDLFQDELMPAIQHDFSGTTRDTLERSMLTISEITQSRSPKITHSGWCPVSLGVTAMMRVAPRDRGAGLTQLKFGVWIAFVGICRPVPPVPGAGLWLEADVTL